MPSLTHSAPEGGPVFDVPDVRTYGVVYKMSMQADSRGAVLLAYTKDPETGQITRTQLRIDLAGVAYMRGRLDRITAADERCQSARAEDPTPCDGPRDAVLILGRTNTGSYGCERHGAALLASIEGGRPVSHSVAGAAIRVHRAAA